MKRRGAAKGCRIVCLGALVILGACGSDDGGTTGSSATTATIATTSIAPTTAPPTTTAPPPTTPTTVAPTPPTTSAPPTTAVGEAQPAIWPAAGTISTTPEAAAADFVTQVFGVTPSLGPFVAGDARSGEITVMVGEVPELATPRSTLVMRQLPPSDGWFVIAAVNDAMTLSSPTPLAVVPAGTLHVTGSGRGFEALVVIEAFVAGSATKLDQQSVMGGSAESPEPFATDLDLSAAQPGDDVVVLMRGGVGLEEDTGEFSALVVTIAA